jgi:predicted RNase H-like HicB family nuclease
VQYIVVVEQGEHNWSAYLPDVWGCVSTGATREEAVRNVQEALTLWCEVAAERGEPIPLPGTWTATVDIEIPQRARGAAAS